MVPDPREAERLVYAEIVRASEESRMCPTADDLLELLGYSSPAGTVSVIKRLERKGMIRVKRYQRSRQIIVIASGKATKAPENQAPHWRERPRDVPSVRLEATEVRQPGTMKRIEAVAKMLNQPVFEVIGHCVYAGLGLIEDELAAERDSDDEQRSVRAA